MEKIFYIWLLKGYEIKKEELVLFDLELYKKADNYIRSFWTGGVDKKLVDKVSKDMDIQFPVSYIEFLMSFGEGGLSGTYIFGIEDEDYSSVYKRTHEFRKKYNINKNWAVIAKESNNWEAYILCLDTNRMKNGECPVIKYDYNNSEIEDFKENFYELFNYKCEVALND